MADKNDIIIRLSASDEGVRTGVNRSQSHLSRLEKTTAASAVRIEGALDRAARNVEQSFRRSFQAAGGLASAYLGSEAVRSIVRYSDQWKSLEGRLGTVTKSSAETATAQERLIKIAQSSRGGLTNTIDLYTKLNQSLTDNQKATFDTFKITETFQKGLAITGESAANTAELVRQFAQGLSSDFKASAQEINSFIDGAPALAKAVSQYLGGEAAADLKRFAKEGELSAQTMLEALQAVSGGIDDQFSKMQVTVSQSLTQLDNAFLAYIGRNDLVQSSTSSLAATISGIADNFETVAGVVTVAGVAIGGRLAGAVAISSAAYVTNTIAATTNALAQKEVALFNVKGAQAALYNATAEAKLTGSYVAASLAVNNLRNATAAYQAVSAGAITTTRALSAAMALVGGPIGLAVTAALVSMTYRTNEAEVAADKWHETLNEFPSIANKLISKNKEIADSTTASVRSQIEDYKQLVIARTALLEQITGVGEKRSAAEEVFGSLGLAGREVAGKLGIGVAPSELIKEIDVAREGAKKLQDLLDNPKKYTGINEAGAGAAVLGKNLSKAATAASAAAKNQNDLNKALADMQGKLDYDRATDGMEEYDKAVYDAREEIKKLEAQYGTFNAAQRKMAEAYVRQVGAFQQGKKAASEEKDRLQQAAEAAEQYAEAMRKPFENALESIQSTIGDTFAGVFDGSVDSASDAANAIKKIFVRMAAEIATLQLIQTSGLDQVFNATGKGGIKGAVGAKGGSVVGDVFRQGTSLLGSTGIGAAIDGFGAAALPSLFATAGIGPTALSAGLGGAPAAAGLLGGAGIGLASIALPVAGIAIGALLSGAFGKSKPHPASNFAASLTDKGANSKLFSKHTDTSTAKALADSVALISQSLVNQGINVAGQTVQGGVDNNRGFLTIGTHDFKKSINDPARTIRFDPNGGEGASNEAFAELTKRLALSAKEAEKYAANLALITTKGRDADAVLTDISFVLGFEKLGDTPKVLTETEQAIVELRKTFKSAAEMADRLGLSVEKVRSVEAQRVKDMLDQSAAGIAARLIEATQPSQANLNQENLRYAAELRDLQALGATSKELHMAEVLHQVNVHKIMEGNVDLQQEALDKEKTRMEVAKELAERFARVQTSMKSLIGDLTTGKFSNLDPQSNVEQMRAQVQMLGKQAQLGDAAAAEELSQLIPAFLELSGQVNGYNEVYERDRVASLNIAEGTLSVAERQISIQQQIASEAQMQTAVLTAGFAGLQSALDRFGGGLTVGDVTGAAAGGERFGARPALNQALAVATGFTGRFSPDASKDQFTAFRAANPQLEPIIAAVMKSQGFANGGLIDGASGGKDTLLARVTKGEFVMSPRAVRAISAPALAVMNTTGKIPDSGMQEGLSRLESRIIDLTKTVAMGGNLTVTELQTMNEELSAIKRHANLTAARS